MNRVYQIQHPCKNRFGKSPDPVIGSIPELAVRNGGLFHFWRIGETQEIVQRNVIQLAELDSGLDLRGGLAMLPGENGLLCDTQAVSQLDLGETVLLAELFKSVLGHYITDFS